MIRVLVVDDSETMQSMMKKALERDNEISVIGTAANGIDAIAFSKRFKPDLITMDIMMPRMNGLEATRCIMQDEPVPIIMVSSITNNDEQFTSFRAIDAGALWVVAKPRTETTGEWDIWSQDLQEMVKSMSKVKVITRRNKSKKPDKIIPSKPMAEPKVIAFAASTGGPNALRDILLTLPEDFPIPILVCQHITQGFVNSFAGWLDFVIKLPVRLAKNYMKVAKGITIASDKGHLQVTKTERLEIIPETNSSKQVPSADFLFSSCAGCYGKNAVGIVLTGMGKDGSEGIGELYKAGAYTVSQDEASSVVYGMPRVANLNGYIHTEFNIKNISELLNRFHK